MPDAVLPVGATNEHKSIAGPYRPVGIGACLESNQDVRTSKHYQ